jgi:hypothetical protein
MAVSLPGYVPATATTLHDSLTAKGFGTVNVYASSSLVTRLSSSV